MVNLSTEGVIFCTWMRLFSIPYSFILVLGTSFPFRSQILGEEWSIIIWTFLMRIWAGHFLCAFEQDEAYWKSDCHFPSPAAHRVSAIAHILTRLVLLIRVGHSNRLKIYIKGHIWFNWFDCWNCKICYIIKCHTNDSKVFFRYDSISRQFSVIE